MTKLKFCVLVPSHPHVRSAKQNKRLNISAYFGLKIVLNELEKAFDIVPDLVTYEDVHRYDVVLVSMLSVDDYFRVAFTFYHRLKGKKNNIWIGGGSAIQNLAPLSDIFDSVLIGRAEGVLIPMFAELLAGRQYQHPSVVHFNDYSENRAYQINYVKHLYPEQLGNEKETMSGCKYNCGYCRYRIASLPPKMRESDRETTMPGNEETFWELEIPNSKPHTTSLDGLEESIRRAVTKRILDDDIIEKFVEIGKQQKNVNLKIYLIAAYPNHSGFDFSSLRSILKEVDRRSTGLNFTLKFHITPFSAEPGTPMQWEPVNVAVNYNNAMRQFKREIGSVFVSDQIQAYLLNSTMSHYSVLLRAIHHRTDLASLDLIRDISSNVYYRSHIHNHTAKFDKLATDHDITPFVRSYEIGARLPSSNISSWRNQESIQRQAIKIRRELRRAALNFTPGPLWLDLPLSTTVVEKYPHLLPRDRCANGSSFDPVGSIPTHLTHRKLDINTI